MDKLLTIAQFAEKIGVTKRTLMRWHADGKLIPEFVLPSGERRYRLEQLEEFRGFAIDPYKEALKHAHQRERAAKAAWKALPPEQHKQGYTVWLDAADRLLSLLDSHGDAGWRIGRSIGIYFDDSDDREVENG
jgi:DNA-binding transcriptional MerR regulator